MIRSLMLVGFRNLGRNRWQALLSVIGITLAVAFTIGITTIVTAVNEDFITERRGNSFVDVTIHGIDDSWISYVNVSSELTSVPNIATVSPAIILTFDLTQVGGTGTVTIYGLDPSSHPDWNLLPVVQGDHSLDRNQVIIPMTMAQRSGVSVGSVLSFGTTTFRVSGIFDDQQLNEFARHGTSDLIIADLKTVREFFGRSGDEVTTVLVSTSNFLDIELTYRRILSVLGDQYNVVMEQTVSSFDRLVLTAYGTTMTVVVLITLFVEFIFLSNLFLIIVNEQQPNIGLMRALGMSRWQVAFLFVLEISVYGVLGSLIGLFLGHVFSTNLMRLLLESQGLPVNRLPPLTGFDVLFAFESGLFIALLAGMYPTVVILRYKISQALYERRHLLTQTDKDVPIRRLFLMFGTIFLVLGSLLTLQASREKAFELRLDSPLAMSALLIFLGLFLIQLLSMWFIPQFIQRMGSQFSKLLIPISTRNLARYRIRSIASVATNAIALTFALTVVIMTATLAAHVPTWYQESFPSTDLIVEFKDDQLLPEENATRMFMAESSVKAMTSIKMAFGHYLGSSDEVVDIFGIDSANFSRFASKNLQQQNLESLGELAAPDTIRVIVTNSFAQAHSLRINDTFQMTIVRIDASTPIVNAKIHGIVTDNVFSLSSNPLQLYADGNVLERVFNVTIGVKYVLLDLFNPSRSSSLSNSLKSRHQAIRNVYSTQEQLNKLTMAIKRQETFLRALTYQSITIAALTQFVAILLSAERSRYEIGIIRANGLNRSRVLLLFVTEGMLLGVIGLIFGWMDSIIASTLLKSYIEQFATVMTLVIPVEELLLWSLFFLVVVFVATLYPGWRTATLPVIRSLDTRAQLFRTTVSLKQLLKNALVLGTREYKQRVASPVGKRLVVAIVAYVVLGYFFIRTLQLMLSVIFFSYLFYLFLKEDGKQLKELDVVARTSERTLRHFRFKRLLSLDFYQDMASVAVVGLVTFSLFRMIDLVVRNLLLAMFHSVTSNLNEGDLVIEWLLVFAVLVLIISLLLVSFAEVAFLRFGAIVLSMTIHRQYSSKPLYHLLEENSAFRNVFMKKGFLATSMAVEIRYLVILLLTIIMQYTDVPLPSMEVLSLVLDVGIGIMLYSLLARHFVESLWQQSFVNALPNVAEDPSLAHAIKKSVKNSFAQRLGAPSYFKEV